MKLLKLLSLMAPWKIGWWCWDRLRNPWVIHPNLYSGIRYEVNRLFDRLAAVITAISVLQVAACSWYFARHGGFFVPVWRADRRYLFVESVLAAATIVILQALLKVLVRRANYAAGRFVHGQRQAAKPVKGYRKLPGHAPCPCGGGKKYRDCCRPLHAVAR